MTGYLLNGLLTVISGLLLWIIKGLMAENRKLRAEREQQAADMQKALSQGVLSLLRVQLIEYHDKYMTGDHIPSYVYENFDEMYKAYKALGGNGTITHMKEEIDSLRVHNH